VLETVKPIDFFFNDGHHNYDAFIQYFNEALPYLSDGAIIVFDDINWSPGMRRAWKEIEDNAKVAVSIDLQKLGVAFVKRNIETKEQYRIQL
jgi:predicted O-methyltransferase YrrM